MAGPPSVPSLPSVASVPSVATGTSAPAVPDPPSAPRTARARVRQELTAEILVVARRHLAEQGAAALSLRSVARDLGMAPSALYRYFDGRDALLSALILSAYEALAETAEAAADEAHVTEGSDTERWQAVPRALRSWAMEHPHEWGLVFGSPVPGYHAPEDTVVPYARIATALLRPVVEANDAGRLQSPARTRPVADALSEAVAPVREALLPDLPASTVVAALEAWIVIIGAVSLEVFGHWRNTILDPGLFFEATTRDVAASVGLR
jgi:AcrR family transcriptional regulator